jgi:hypothetical protein
LSKRTSNKTRSKSLAIEPRKIWKHKTKIPRRSEPRTKLEASPWQSNLETSGNKSLTQIFGNLKRWWNQMCCEPSKFVSSGARILPK